MRGLEPKVQALREQLGPAWRVQGLLLVRGHAPEPGARAGAPTTCSARRYPAPSQRVAQGPDGSRHADAERRRVRLDERRRHPTGCGTSLSQPPRPCNTRSRGRRADRRQAGPPSRHAQPALRPACADPWPVRALSPRLPRGHRRVRGLRGVDRHPVDHRQHLERLPPVRVRRADPTIPPADAARLRRPRHGGGHGRPGVRRLVPAVRCLQHRLQDRRVAPAPRRQRAPRRTVPGRAASGRRSPSMSPAAMSARCSWGSRRL